MRRKKYTIWLIALILIITACVVFYPRYIRLGVLYASMRIERWASFLVKRDYPGSTGRNCRRSSDEEIRALYLLSNNNPDQGVEIKNLIDQGEVNTRCYKKAKLVRMTYYADMNVVSGVYRCEEGNVIGEFQLAFYLSPDATPQNDCAFAVFYKDWNIPAGQATMFSLP